MIRILFFTNATLQRKMGHITNIYLMDSDEDAIVDFMKDDRELNEKTNLESTRASSTREKESLYL